MKCNLGSDIIFIEKGDVAKLVAMIHFLVKKADYKRIWEYHDDAFRIWQELKDLTRESDD